MNASGRDLGITIEGTADAEPTLVSSGALRHFRIGLNRRLAGLTVPISYRYDAFTNRLMTRCEGAVSLQQVVDHFRQLGRDARLRPHCDVLLDLTFQTRLPTSEEMNDLMEIIEDMHELLPFGRCAVIAPDDLSYGLGRMFQGFAWPMFAGIRVFRNNANAVTWLNEEP